MIQVIIYYYLQYLIHLIYFPYFLIVLNFKHYLFLSHIRFHICYLIHSVFMKENIQLILPQKKIYLKYYDTLLYYYYYYF